MRCSPARADESVFGSPLEDLKLYVTAPLRWDEEDWLYFGGALVAIGGSHALDSRVRSHFATGSNAALTGEDKNSLRDALPTLALIAGTGTGALFFRNRDGYRETWGLLEAGILSSVTSETLRFAAGRERPDATLSPNQWRKSGNSFPSLHTTAAAAVGMVFAESGGDDYRWLRRILGYGIVAGTAYIRVRDNDHWLSDTVAGGAVGFATARFVLNRQVASEHPSALSIQPMKGGWMLSYSIQTH
ncbi:MAG TPA: phosphatase PAP2 family protein [Steroidobacteraceae bacterium]